MSNPRKTRFELGAAAIPWSSRGTGTNAHRALGRSLGLLGMVLGLGVVTLGCSGHSGMVGTEADWTPKMQILDGDKQSTPINTAFAKPLKVRLLSYDGRPIANRGVSFVAPETGASCQFGGSGHEVVGSTDANGEVVSPPLQANGLAGTYVVQAGAGGMMPCLITLTNQ
jgi:hypothetical protein